MESHSLNPNLIYIIIGFAIVVVVIILRSKVNPSGPHSLPPAGQATMSDVERLIQAGETISAIRCYREIHHCGLREAKEAVEKLRDQMKH